MNSQNPGSVFHDDQASARCPVKFVRRALFVACFCVGFLVSSYTCADQVKLAWDPSAGAHVTGYRVYFSKKSGQYTKKQMVDVGPVTSCEIDLAAGKWFIAVTAYDAEGHESAYSAPIVWEKGASGNSPAPKANSPGNPQKTAGEGEMQVESPPEKSLIPPSTHRNVQDSDGGKKLIPPSIDHRGSKSDSAGRSQ